MRIKNSLENADFARKKYGFNPKTLRTWKFILKYPIFNKNRVFFLSSLSFLTQSTHPAHVEHFKFMQYSTIDLNAICMHLSFLSAILILMCFVSSHATDCIVWWSFCVVSCSNLPVYCVYCVVVNVEFNDGGAKPCILFSASVLFIKPSKYSFCMQ